jgi:hypothetical protein
MMRTERLWRPDGTSALARRPRTVGAGTLGGLMTEASVAQQSPVLPFHDPSRRAACGFARGAENEQGVLMLRGV